MKHNYRLRKNAGRTVAALFAILALFLLVSGAYCASSGKQMVIDFVFDELEGSDEAKADPEPEEPPDEGESPETEESKGTPVITGTVGILRFFEQFIFRDTPRENQVVEEGDDFDFLSITEDMFELSYHDIKLYDNGSIYDGTTNTYITFEEENGNDAEEGTRASGEGDGGDIMSKLREEWFPIGGVKKKDYEIYDPLANDTVRAEYVRKTEIRDRTCYVYNVKLQNQTVVEIDDWDGNPFRVYADEDTDYYLDRKTTVPVNLHVKLTIGVDFPDLTRLQPDFENRAENRTLTVLIKDPDSVTGWKVEEVREEHHRTSYLDPEDKNLIWFEEWVERYDNSTGEPLEPEQQENTVTKYVVDRTTYRYVPGLGGSQRQGYYTFPIGRVEPKDYPMWDEGARQQSVARFVKETKGPLGRPAYLFEMRSENFTFEESDLLFPVDNPGALELVGDSTARYWLDKETGFPLDLSWELVVSIRSGGPLHGVKEPVYKAYFELPEEVRTNLSKIVAVIAVLLKCVNDKPLDVFYADLQFSSNLQADLAEAARLIGYLFDTLDYYIPLAAVSLGSFILLIILLRTYINHRRRKNRRRKLEANLKRLK